jgi:hypothetical protein
MSEIYDDTDAGSDFAEWWETVGRQQQQQQQTQENDDVPESNEETSQA